MIRKQPNGTYRVLSEKKDAKGNRKNLGESTTLAGAKKRLAQVEWFKKKRP